MVDWAGEVWVDRVDLGKLYVESLNKIVSDERDATRVMKAEVRLASQQLQGQLRGRAI